MKDTLATKIHLREVRDSGPRSKSYRKLYGDRRLLNDLDIVNELDGHSGCVNALSWSKSGHLLASGSDDQHLNIHTYQPTDATSQFKLSTTVATGHSANIFSVKFMPHSQDRTVITAAGDGEVRVFDIEHAGTTSTASRASTSASEGRRRGRNTVYNGVRYLSDGDTNARVYRSHADRVKRIVTESSPYLFLTCSEDGEVRQWDLRQPSSAYPAPRGHRYENETSIPPPLISYKRYSLDLNTISCSASQPHYIALGGAHLHAFLHDRRMAGRDRLKEMGRALSPVNKLSSDEQELLGQATQCVRKFAPTGQKKMKRADNGHITACKISDARPDEMIVSWSGDHIYSFDLIRDPADEENESISPLRERKSTGSRERKRKRRPEGSEASLSKEAVPPTRQRTDSSSAASTDAALRIRYQNGQSEDIPLPNHIQQYEPLTERQRLAQHIAKSTVRIRSSLFSPSSERSSDTARFTEALSLCASILSDMDEIMRDWGYPMGPEPGQVFVQQTLRKTREAGRRFVQTAGTLARVLGGNLRTPTGVSPMIAQFTAIEVKRNELETSQRERFSYDFLKAILLWLDSGIGRLIEGFTRPSDMAPTSKAATRLPIPEDEATTEAVDDLLIPYLLQLAGDSRIVNVDANAFETDDSRSLFQTEKQAVLAFAAAVRIPFEDLSSAIVLAEGAERIHAQDRQTAHRFWGKKVARGILLNAAEGVNFVSLDRAFGGLGKPVREVTTEEARLDLLRQGSTAEEDETLQTVEILSPYGTIVDGAITEDITAASQELRTRSFEPLTATADGDDETADDTNDDTEDDDRDDGAADSDDDEDHTQSDSSSEADEEDGVPNLGAPRYFYRTAFERRRLRPTVEQDVHCARATRSYRGHCNVRTVKDVNYFGPDDEYVVSGSDDGNFFIWDRKTSELVNLLEGDGEVVNVIQGHPYETMLAVSGIDHTIKIFSPDGRARDVARLGKGISAHDASSFSSIAWPMRLSRREPRRPTSSQTAAQTTSEPAMPTLPEDDEDYVAPSGLSSRKRMHDSYRIMQNNNMEREGGNQEAAISLPHAQLLQLLFGQLGNAGVLPSFED